MSSVSATSSGNSRFAGISQEIESKCRSKFDLTTAEGRKSAANYAAGVAATLLEALPKLSIPEKKVVRDELKKLLALGERFKSGKFLLSRPAPIPCARSNRERIVILESGRVGGLKLLEWAGPPEHEDFEGPQYSDPAGLLRLSTEQEATFNGWKRPEKNDGAFTAERKIDLAQEGVTDCSIVASMCAAINREERGFSKILSNNIFPQTYDGTPYQSTNGKYVVRLYINGCFRTVPIDDFLPTTKCKDKSLHVVDRANPQLIWPALIEKAYLKVMGGYDFPGSNCGMDLLALTGWIPEYIFLEADNLDTQNLWRRMHHFWETGDVLITLGTGKLTQREEIDLGLVSQHDYAVISLKEFEGRKMLLVKNPWSNSAVWRGPSIAYEANEDSEDSDSNDEEINPPLYSDSDDSDSDFDAPEDESTKRLRKEFQLPPGVAEDVGIFWIDLQSVCSHFRSVYFNWNPELFPHRIDTHFDWDVNSKTGPAGSLQDNTQYALSSRGAPEKQLVWLLLQRHITGSTDAEKYIGNGYISLYVFDKDGKRVLVGQKPLIRGHFVDSTHTLLRIENMPPNTTYTVVVCSEDLAMRKHRFTLSAFSKYPAKLEAARDDLPYKTSIAGRWTPETAGGEPRCEETFRHNPQYRLRIRPDNGSNGDARVVLVLESPDEVNIHTMLTWEKGTRVQSATTRDIICSSGQYRRGCAMAEVMDLPFPGDYTVVANTLGPGELGSFLLTIHSQNPVELTTIPSESAGKVIRRVKSDWLTYSKISYQIKVSCLTTISASIKGGSKNAAAASPLKIMFTAKKYDHIPYEVLGDCDEDEFRSFTGEVDVYAEWRDVRMVIERSGGTNADFFEVAVMGDRMFEIGEERRDD